MNDALFRSWLFEVFDTTTQSVLESFTLILPPTSITIKEKQRTAVTKTFGETFIDDYGPDNVEITISGYSGLSKAFSTYSTDGASVSTPAASKGRVTNEKFDQKSAFMYFRGRIMRYKYGGNFENKRLRVYNLYDEEVYECVLLDFTTNREASTPLRYPFSISLLVMRNLLTPERGDKTDSPMLSIDFSTFNTRTDEISAALDPFEALQALSPPSDPILPLPSLTDAVKLTSLSSLNIAAHNAIMRFKDTVQSYRVQAQNIIDQGKTFAEIPTFLVSQAVDEAVEISRTANKLFTAGALTTLQYANILKTAEAGWQVCARMWSSLIWKSAVEAAELQGPLVTSPDLSPASSNSSSVAPSRDVYVPAQQTEVVSVMGTQQKQLAYSGFTNYPVKGGDTLQSIASTYLKDSSLWPYLALLNSVGSNKDLLPGMVLQLPVIRTTSNTNTNIVPQLGTSDLGVDIALDSSGDFAITNGALQTIADEDNVVQAINSLLSTPIGSIIKHTTYGIVLQVGTAGVAIALTYTRMALQAALLSDPRIKAVEDIKLSSNGGALAVEFTAIFNRSVSSSRLVSLNL